MDLDSLMSEPAPVPEQTPASKDAQQPPVAPESIEKEVEGEQETAGTLAQQTEEDEQIVAAAVTPTEEEHKEPEHPVPAAEGEGAPVVEAIPAAAVEEAQPAVPDDVDEPTLPPTPSVATPPVHTSVPQQPTPVATPPPTATSSFNGKADSKKEVKEKPLTPLPEGLTAASPSVKREVGAVAAWRTNPKDPHPLLSLIQSSTDHAELPDARAWYEHFLTLYPTAAPQYLSYIELELAHDYLQQAEALFKRAFTKDPAASGGKAGGPCFPLAYPPLWTSYLHYIRRQNPLPPIPPSSSTLPSAYLAARLQITQAYDFALSHVGLDPFATPIWREYLAFVREGEAKSTWEEQSRVSEVRALVGRAVRVPMEDLEAVWREYDAFEGQVNRLTAKKFLAEKLPTYMSSRTLLKDLRAHLPPSAALFPPAVPTPPTWSDADQMVVRRWKDYVEWERSNPCELKGEEEGEWKRRVEYALKKAVGGEGRFYPELWYMAADWEKQEERMDDAAGFLKSGLQANPNSFLLSFALAELEENRKDFPAVHNIYMTLLATLSTEITDLKKSVDDEASDAVAGLVASYENAAVQNGVGTGSVGGNNQGGEPEMVDMAEFLRSQEREKKDKEREVRIKWAKEVEEKEKGAGLVWVMYMRFGRRSEGIKSGRAIFAKARKFPHAAWQVFEASALIEYHCSKDPAVATRIFELGLKVFGEKLEFVDRYLAFLIMINDDQNARVLFEKSVTKFKPEESRGLWERWARYEYLFGDIASAQRLDARFAEAFPKDSSTKNFARRHAYTGIDEIARVDLGFGIRPHPVNVPTGPRAPPTGPSSSIPLGPRSATITAATTPVPAAPAPPAIQARASPVVPFAQTTPAVVHPSRAPMVAAAVPGGPTLPASLPPAPLPLGPTASPAKRPLDDPHARHPSVDRGERMSLRNEPLSKRHRAESPAVATGAGGLGRDGTPPVHKLPDNKPSPSQNATLGWFVGLLPPVRSFDGPVFPVDEVMNCIASSSRIVGIAPPPPTIPPPSIGPPAGGRPGPGGYGYDRYPPPHQQQQQPPYRGGPSAGGGGYRGYR